MQADKKRGYTEPHEQQCNCSAKKKKKEDILRLRSLLGEARYWSLKLYSRETSCASKELFSQYIWVLSGSPNKVSGSYERDIRFHLMESIRNWDSYSHSNIHNFTSTITFRFRKYVNKETDGLKSDSIISLSRNSASSHFPSLQSTPMVEL